MVLNMGMQRDVGLLPGERDSFLLEGRGRIGFRRIAGPKGAPTIVLLHGLGATADLNFATLYPALLGRCQVLAPDLRGHGEGIKDIEPFTLDICADDIAALVRGLGLGPCLLLGYSMGGPVALLLAERHPDLVSGTVLCATAASFGLNSAGRFFLKAVGVAGDLWLRVPSLGRAASLPPLSLLASPPRLCRAPALKRLSEAIRPVGPSLPSLPHLLEAAGELARFDGAPLAERLGVPAVVVVTMADHLVPEADQRHLAASIPGCHVVEIAGGHDACARHPWRFASAVTHAVRILGGKPARSRSSSADHEHATSDGPVLHGADHVLPCL
jgi:pimeloyl-ACP methyl ester carboxylesterase